MNSKVLQGTSTLSVGFSGTREGMTDRQAQALWLILSMHPMNLHHGDCLGADAEAHLMAARMGIGTIVHPPAKNEARAFCTGDVVLEPREYLMRNRDIVDSCDLMIAAPLDHHEEIRSGTWATIRYTRAQGKPLIILDR